MISLPAGFFPCVGSTRVMKLRITVFREDLHVVTEIDGATSEPAVGFRSSACTRSVLLSQNLL